MYVTGGQFKGRKINIPNCAKPTLSKTRESVFNVLLSYFGDFSDLVFLDLFSGSGIMSLEALSRGFRTISIDKNPSAINLIKKNFKGINGCFEIYLDDAVNFVKKNKPEADVIYLDPPWDMDYGVILNLVFENFKNAVVVIEYDKKRAHEFSKIYAEKLAPFREKVYGRCKLDFLEL